MSLDELVFGWMGWERFSVWLLREKPCMELVRLNSTIAQYQKHR